VHEAAERQPRGEQDQAAPRQHRDARWSGARGGDASAGRRPKRRSRRHPSNRSRDRRSLRPAERRGRRPAGGLVAEQRRGIEVAEAVAGPPRPEPQPPAGSQLAQPRAGRDDRAPPHREPAEAQMRRDQRAAPHGHAAPARRNPPRERDAPAAGGLDPRAGRCRHVDPAAGARREGLGPRVAEALHDRAAHGPSPRGAQRGRPGAARPGRGGRARRQQQQAGRTGQHEQQDQEPGGARRWHGGDVKRAAAAIGHPRVNWCRAVTIPAQSARDTAHSRSGR
jgi:hypothetical protein